MYDKNMTGCFAGNVISSTAKCALVRKENGSSFVLNATVQVIGTERTDVHFRSIVRSFLFFFNYNITHFDAKKYGIFVKLHGMLFDFNTCTVHLLLFCTMTNQCTIN